MKHKVTRFVILKVGRVNDHNQNHSERVDDDMSLTASDLLSAVKTTEFTAFSSADRLTVDDGRRWRRFLSCRLPNQFTQSIMNVFPCSLYAPLAKDTVDGISIRKLRWQVTPLASRPIPIQDRIHDSSPIDRLSSPLLGLRQKFADDMPLLIRKTAGILP